MDNKILYRSVIADIAKTLKIRRVWPGEFKEQYAVYNGTSQIGVMQARQLIDSFADNVTPRLQGVQFGEFSVSQKYQVQGRVGENETSSAQFFEAVGSFTFEQNSYIVTISYVDVTFLKQDAVATAMIVIYPA